MAFRCLRRPSRLATSESYEKSASSSFHHRRSPAVDAFYRSFRSVISAISITAVSVPSIAATTGSIASAVPMRENKGLRLGCYFGHVATDGSSRSDMRHYRKYSKGKRHQNGSTHDRLLIMGHPPFYNERITRGKV